MSRIFITGDTHGDYDVKKLNRHNFTEQNELTKNDYLIIAGDFGCVWYGSKDVSDRCPDYEVPPVHRTYIGKDDYWLKWYDEKNHTTLFVDGNHENHALLDAYPIEEWGQDKNVNIIKKETNDKDKIIHYTKLIEKMKEDIVEYVDEKENELCLA